MDKVLITGGAGFIGLKLAKFLSNQYSVCLLDRPGQFKDIHQKFECYEIDISEKFSIDEQFDYVFHIAAQSGGKGSLDNPQLDCIWNCLGTVNILKLAQKLKVKEIKS